MSACRPSRQSASPASAIVMLIGFGFGPYLPSTSGSVIGVHSPQFALVSGGRGYLVDPATTQYLTRSSERVLRSYARQMGVSPTLISVAHGVPHHSGRVLTPSEISRYGL